MDNTASTQTKIRPRPKLNSRTHYRIRKMVKIIKHDPRITNQELMKIFKCGLSSVSRMKTLAVEYHYAPREEIMGLRFGHREPEPACPIAPAGTVEISTPTTPNAIEFSDAVDVVISNVLRKLSLLVGNNKSDREIWLDIASVASIMAASPAKKKEVELP